MKIYGCHYCRAKGVLSNVQHSRRPMIDFQLKISKNTQK